MSLMTGILLSGGMDSTALAFLQRPSFAYTIDYGQIAAAGEIRAATAVCQTLSIKHRIIRANCRAVGTGQMAGVSPDQMAPVPEWWPFRNQLIITLAASAAITDSVQQLSIASVRSDSAHKDGQPRFFALIDELTRFQEGGIAVNAPVVHLTSEELVVNSKIPQSILAWSHSCHVSEFACGVCRGCVKHSTVMGALGYADY